MQYLFGAPSAHSGPLASIGSRGVIMMPTGSVYRQSFYAVSFMGVKTLVQAIPAILQ